MPNGLTNAFRIPSAEVERILRSLDKDVIVGFTISIYDYVARTGVSAERALAMLQELNTEDVLVVEQDHTTYVVYFDRRRDDVALGALSASRLCVDAAYALFEVLRRASEQAGPLRPSTDVR